MICKEQLFIFNMDLIILSFLNIDEMFQGIVMFEFLERNV